MKRFALAVLGSLGVIALMFIPALGFSSGGTDTTPEFATITDYNATFDVADDGTLTAHERLTVDLPFGRHGIFRFFDVADASDPKARLRPYDITVTRDGQPDGVDITRQGNGRYVVVKIGRAETTISDKHVYDIRYKVDGVIGQSGGKAQFYWNLIPSGWRMPIEQSTLTVKLPGDAQPVKCAIGVGADTGCTAKAGAGNQFVVTTGKLAPNTPVTVQTPLTIAAPDRDWLPWSIRYDNVFGRSLIGAIIFGVLSLLGGLIGWWLARSTREPEPPFPLMYAPPEGIGPAQAAYLFTERVNADAYPATMLDLASKGVIDLDRTNQGWQIGGKPRADWSQVDEVGVETARQLGVTSGDQFVVDGGTGTGQVLQSARSDFEASVKGWSRRNGLIEVKYLVALAGLFVVGGGALALAAFVWNPLAMSLLGLPFGLFAVNALPVLDARSQTIRTQSGRDLWSRIGGFRRVLATPSSEARFDFSGRKELYTAYIPWAVAFGVAEAWADKYRQETGEEPPAPSYVGGYYAGGYYGGAGSAFADDFNTSVGSAISAYEASIAPQGGTGGGFSGGGGFGGGFGGGGGGGGSW